MFEAKNEEKKVEYLELIYDLIFVYLIGRNSSLVGHAVDGFINWEMFLTFALCSLIVIQIWNLSTFYINRYGNNGIRDHIWIFINMYLLYYMADATRTDWRDEYIKYNAAWCLILINIGVQYLITLKKTQKEAPWEAKQIKWNILELFIQAALVSLSIPVYELTGIPLAPAAMVFGIVFTAFSGRIHSLVAVDFAHLSERAMLYVVFTFGEMIIAIAGYFSGSFNANTIYFSLFAFLIVVGLFLSYEMFYNSLVDREMSTNGTGYMTIHVFLIFALSCITMALEFMPETEFDPMQKVIFLTAAFVLFYVFLLLLGRYTGKQTRPPASFFIKIIAIGLTFIALMYIFYANSYLNIAITAIYVYIVLFIIIRFKNKIGR